MLKACIPTLLVLFFGFQTSLAATIEDSFFDSDGVQIRFIDEGRGTPVLLIHGFSSDMDRGWRERGIVNRLTSAGYRVIAYDNRGHGKSDKPQGASKYGSNMVEDGRRLLDHLNIDRAHVVGYSFGGRLANKLRELYPNRVISLTLGGTNVPTEPPKVTAERIEKLDKRLRGKGINDEHDRAALIAVRISSSELLGNASELGRNKVPVLVIRGEQDQPEKAQELAKITSNAEFKIVPGDHASAPATPEFTEALLTFLGEH